MAPASRQYIPIPYQELCNLTDAQPTGRYSVGKKKPQHRAAVMGLSCDGCGEHGWPVVLAPAQQPHRPLAAVLPALPWLGCGAGWPVFPPALPLPGSLQQPSVWPGCAVPVWVLPLQPLAVLPVQHRAWVRPWLPAWRQRWPQACWPLAPPVSARSWQQAWRRRWRPTADAACSPCRRPCVPACDHDHGDAPVRRHRHLDRRHRAPPRSGQSPPGRCPGRHASP